MDIFTKKRGKIRAIAKGSRKPGTKLSIGTNPLTYGVFILYKGRNFYYIKEIDIKKTYLSSHLSLNSYDALEILKYIDKFSPFEKQDFKIYGLLLHLLHDLDNNTFSSLLYLIKLIEFLGFKPNITRCSICGKKLRGLSFYLDIENGIAICKDCLKEEKRSIIEVEKEIGIFLAYPKKNENYLTRTQKEKLYRLTIAYLENLEPNKK